MKLLRLKLRQSKAHYRRIENIGSMRMTYPLPPLSTVIGALHYICKFDRYHEMNVSVQGNFDSINIDYYTHHHFLNSTMLDRGTLVKCVDENNSSAYTIVSECLKAQGSNHLKKENVKIFDERLLDEFIYMRENDKKNTELLKYKSLVKSIQSYEVVSSLELIIHIEAEEYVLNTIASNIDELVSLGRSEDFVEVEECEFVETVELDDCEIKSNYYSYVKYEDIVEENVFMRTDDNANSSTVYSICKNYAKEKGKRVFNKVKVALCKDYEVYDTNKVKYDGEYLINLL